MNFGLRTKSYADYGNLSLTIISAIDSYPLLVQLTDEKGKTEQEIYAKEPQIFEFTNIDPSKYLIRVIFDANGNGQWDTGNYLKKIQPEKVSYYPGVIEMRANWEFPVTFTLLD